MISEIGAWEAEHGEAATGYRYYERWLAALERTLREEGSVDPARDRAGVRDELEHEWAHDHA